MIFPESLGEGFRNETTRRFSRFLAEKQLTGTVRVDSADALLIDERVEARSDKQSGVTLRLSDDGAELTVDLEGRLAARDGVQDLFTALNLWAREVTEGRAAL